MSTLPLLTWFLIIITSTYAQPTWDAKNLDDNSIKYLQQHHPMELLSVSEQMEINAAKYRQFRASITGVIFSGVFTDYAVLQRAPAFASLYGAADTPNTQIVLSMKDESTSKITTYNTQSMNNGDWKITLPKTFPNGGLYTFEVKCPKCKSNKNDTINNVVFGDVFFCAGQSNMQCEIHFTFSQNYTYANITKLNKYGNIRFFTAPSRSTPDNMTSYVVPREGKPSLQWSLTNTSTIPILQDFSATCFYTALQLSDNHGMNDIHFGLIDTAVGGTMVEAWTKNHTIDKRCSSGTACPGAGCGGLYNGQVLPWINMTIKTALWYQGENNVFEGGGGNWYNNTGYSCMENLMIEQWRANFSVVPKTTPADFPFGVVTLAAGTSEGHQPSMGHFRWSQSLNQDLLPAMSGKPQTNLFMIQAHDIGDPWYSGCGANCLDAYAPYTPNNSLGNGTQWKMGPIHPRPKMWVGERMARVVAKFVYGVDQIYSGPLIDGCRLDGNSKKISIMFNETLMYGEQLFYQKFEAWYNESLNSIVKYQNAIQLNNGGKWVSVDDSSVSVSNSNGPSVIVDISEYDVSNITGIRYAWSDYPCCGDLNKKLHPCPMNSCPFQTAKSRLPAVPFWAQIVGGKCQCFAPQVC